MCSYFFSLSAFYTQKVATHCKEQNKKESWQLVKKTKELFKVIKCQKNDQQIQNV